MKKVLLVGKTGCGKTTLSQCLSGEIPHYKKTQAIEVLGDNIIDTPGEYIERKQFYKALMVTAVEADYVLMLQDCTEDQCSFSPRMKCMFNRPMIGVMTKTDLATDSKKVEILEEMLRLAGADCIFYISCHTGEGLDSLIEYLQ